MHPPKKPSPSCKALEPPARADPIDDRAPAVRPDSCGCTLAAMARSPFTHRLSTARSLGSAVITSILVLSAIAAVGGASLSRRSVTMLREGASRH